MAKESFFSIKDIFKDRRKLTVFSICVGLALFMWLLISLGKNYSTTILVPVKYINFPENKTLLNEVNNELAVNVSGSGYDLLQYDGRLEDDTLVIDMNRLKISVLGGYQQGSLDPAIISKELQERINGELSINRVLSDSLKFQFDLKVSRLIAVKPKVDFQLPNGYVLLDSVSSIPSEVEVVGALSLLDTLSYIETSPLSLGELKKSRKTIAGLSREIIGEDAVISQDSVEIEFKVDQLTEKAFMIEPKVANLPDSLEMLLFPKAVEVYMQVPLSQYDLINARDVYLQVDYNALDLAYPVLPVSLESWPVLARNVRLRENQVEVVLNRVEE